MPGIEPFGANDVKYFILLRDLSWSLHLLVRLEYLKLSLDPCFSMWTIPAFLAKLLLP